MHKAGQSSQVTSHGIDQVSCFSRPDIHGLVGYPPANQCAFIVSGYMLQVQAREPPGTYGVDVLLYQDNIGIRRVIKPAIPSKENLYERANWKTGEQVD